MVFCPDRHSVLYYPDRHNGLSYPDRHALFYPDKHMACFTLKHKAYLTLTYIWCFFTMTNILFFYTGKHMAWETKWSVLPWHIYSLFYADIYIFFPPLLSHLYLPPPSPPSSVSISLLLLFLHLIPSLSSPFPSSFSLLSLLISLLLLFLHLLPPLSPPSPSSSILPFRSSFFSLM